MAPIQVSIRTLSREAAFTMIEVLMAIVLTGLLALGVISALSVSHMSDRFSQEVISGGHVAQEVMESLEVTPYSALLSVDGSIVTEGPFVATTSVDLVTVGLLRVHVQVTSSLDPTVNVEVVTLVADPI